MVFVVKWKRNIKRNEEEKLFWKLSYKVVIQYKRELLYGIQSFLMFFTKLKPHIYSDLSALFTQ